MRFTSFALLTFLALLLIGCSDDKPKPIPVVLNYWRAISNPNVLLTMEQAQNKLSYDLAQCKCSNFPLNVPHNETALYAPDIGRLAETAATKADRAGGCSTSPDAVLIECMRTRGWEPTACSGRIATVGGTQCAVSIGTVPPYPDEYPFKNPHDEGFGSIGDSPAEARQNYPR